MSQDKVGVWLIGALGSISTTVMLGALAFRKELVDLTGMVTATGPFCSLELAPVEHMQFGGCDVRDESLRDAVNRMPGEAGAIDPAILKEVMEDLESIEPNLSRGTSRNCGEAIATLAGATSGCETTLRQEIAGIADRLGRFKTANQVDEVVVVNLASTEPPMEIQKCHENIEAFEDCLDRNEINTVRASTIYAYSAIQAGCPYINFTPSNGALFPAMVQFAAQKGVPVMGNDGKTGETLVKSALAPMFTCRNLEVLSWEGFNILGNLDGRILAHPENKESKILTKDAVLSKILGYSPHSRVHINYVPSLGDQKTAWDFIHFRGFLGARMSLQFVWQGYDSFLAAPLVLDLVRLAHFAKSSGEAGLMPHLACYFKEPLGAQEHGLYEQFRMLLDYVARAERKVN